MTQQASKGYRIPRLPLVLLAGGLGTRMREWAEKGVPKALIPVAGTPFIGHQLRSFAEQGITEALVCSGYMSDKIERYVGDGSAFGLRVQFSAEDPTRLLGTAGALRRAHERGLLPENFFLMYGDSFLPIDFGQVQSAFEAQAAPALMTVYRNSDLWDQSNVILAAPRPKGLGHGPHVATPLAPITLYDKKRDARGLGAFEYIDYGLSILKRGLIASLPAGQRHDLADLLRELSLKGQLAGFEVTEPFYEIGTPEGLARFESWVQASAASANDAASIKRVSGTARGTAPVPQPLLLLDRDGVLNRVLIDPATGLPDSPMRAEQVEILPGVPEAVARLTRAGYGLAIVTNQPAAAKGKTSREELEAAHARVVAEAERAGGRILSSHICFHRHEDDCLCRKPKPGLLRTAFEQNPRFVREGAWIVGDRWVDLCAGQELGLKLAFVGPEQSPSADMLRQKAIRPDFWGPDLPSFTRFLLG